MRTLVHLMMMVGRFSPNLQCVWYTGASWYCRLVFFFFFAGGDVWHATTAITSSCIAAPVVVSSRPARATARVAASKVKSYKMDVDSDSEEEEEEQDGSSSEDMAEDSDSSFGL